MQGVISSFAGNRYRFCHLRMNKVAVAAFAASINKACSLKFFDELFYLRWHNYNSIILIPAYQPFLLLTIDFAEICRYYYGKMT